MSGRKELLRHTDPAQPSSPHPKTQPSNLGVAHKAQGIPFPHYPLQTLLTVVSWQGMGHSGSFLGGVHKCTPNLLAMARVGRLLASPSPTTPNSRLSQCTISMGGCKPLETKNNFVYPDLWAVCPVLTHHALMLLVIKNAGCCPHYRIVAYYNAHQDCGQGLMGQILWLYFTPIPHPKPCRWHLH